MLHIHQSFSNATRLKRLGACRLDDSWRSCATLLGSAENLRTPTKSVRQLANLPAQPQLRTAKRHNSSWFISYCSWFSPPFFVQVQLSTGEATEQGDMYIYKYNGVVILDVANGINPSLLPTCQVKRCPHMPAGSLRFSAASLHRFESSNWNGLLSSGSSAGSSTCAKQNLHDSRTARFFGRSTCST